MENRSQTQGGEGEWPKTHALYVKGDNRKEHFGDPDDELPQSHAERAVVKTPEGTARVGQNTTAGGFVRCTECGAQDIIQDSPCKHVKAAKDAGYLEKPK